MKPAPPVTIVFMRSFDRQFPVEGGRLAVDPQDDALAAGQGFERQLGRSRSPSLFST